MRLLIITGVFIVVSLALIAFAIYTHRKNERLLVQWKENREQLQRVASHLGQLKSGTAHLLEQYMLVIDGLTAEGGLDGPRSKQLNDAVDRLRYVMFHDRRVEIELPPWAPFAAYAALKVDRDRNLTDEQRGELMLIIVAEAERIQETLNISADQLMADIKT